MANDVGDLRDRVILVAGASSGMGRATEMALADTGARIVLASCNRHALDILADEIARTPGRALAVPTDVTNRVAVERLVEATLAEYGQIDAAVITAGTNIPRRTIDELTTDNWADMLAVNPPASFNITQGFVPALRERGGQIVYASSSAAKKPDASGVSYQATKAGIVGLAHGTMEMERKHGIRSAVIFPGLTDTPLVETRPTPTPPDVLARSLQPEDVTAACVFVQRLSPRAHVPELLLYPSQL